MITFQILYMYDGLSLVQFNLKSKEIVLERDVASWGNIHLSSLLVLSIASVSVMYSVVNPVRDFVATPPPPHIILAGSLPLVVLCAIVRGQLISGCFGQRFSCKSWIFSKTKPPNASDENLGRIYCAVPRQLDNRYPSRTCRFRCYGNYGCTV